MGRRTRLLAESCGALRRYSLLLRCGLLAVVARCEAQRCALGPVCVVPNVTATAMGQTSVYVARCADSGVAALRVFGG
jgi:hypothetical protein